MSCPIVRGLIGVLAGCSISAFAFSAEHGITMVDIPSGSFTMGSCTEKNSDQAAFLGKSLCQVDDDARNREGPQRKVTVPSFQMSKTEVTLGQFKRFIMAAGREDIVTSDFIKYNAHGENAPVTYVSWHDAQAFIRWLNKTHGGGWRLPSEAEWEYACRAGSNHTYCGGNNINDVAWHRGNSSGHPQTVGTKRANAFGLHDMSGNVFEWVEDCWHEDYTGAPANSFAWTNNCDSSGRVLRGGSWFDKAKVHRTANRMSMPNGMRLGFYGIRLARTL